MSRAATDPARAANPIPTTRLRSAVVAALLTLALVATGCTAGGPIRLEATFDDVIDLVEDSHVRAGDVTIGSVTSITLTDDDQAEVVMAIQRDTGLPSKVEAVLRRAALLGERYIELRPVNDSGRLQAGSIQATKVVSDLEDLVGTGNALIAGVSADRLASAVQVGALALGGRGNAIGTFLERLESFVGRYEQSSDEVVRLIDASDDLVAGLASQAEANAAALEELARSSRALEAEDERLLDAVEDLRRLSDIADEILSENRDELDDLIRRLKLVSEQILRVGGGLQGVLTFFPRHNIHVPNGVLLEQAQVWNDFSVCGLDSEPDNPSNTCQPPNPGDTNHPPPDYPGPDACDDRHVDCPYPPGADPYRPGQDRNQSESGSGASGEAGRPEGGGR